MLIFSLTYLSTVFFFSGLHSERYSKSLKILRCQKNIQKALKCKRILILNINFKSARNLKQTLVKPRYRIYIRCCSLVNSFKLSILHLRSVAGMAQKSHF